MKRTILFVISIIIPLFTAACRDIQSTVPPPSDSSIITGIWEDVTESSDMVSVGRKTSDDPQYVMLKDAMWKLRWRQATYTLAEMLSQFDQIIVRDELAVPYAKVHLKNGYIAFLFYDDSKMLTDIWITDRFLTQDDIENWEVGKTTLREVVESDPYAICAAGSYESITAHILPEGIYVIRCSYNLSADVGVIGTIEFIDNKEFGELGEYPVRRYEMIIPYILPSDRNMG